MREATGALLAFALYFAANAAAASSESRLQAVRVAAALEVQQKSAPRASKAERQRQESDLGLTPETFRRRFNAYSLEAGQSPLLGALKQRSGKGNEGFTVGFEGFDVVGTVSKKTGRVKALTFFISNGSTKTGITRSLSGLMAGTLAVLDGDASVAELTEVLVAVTSQALEDIGLDDAEPVVRVVGESSIAAIAGHDLGLVVLIQPLE